MKHIILIAALVALGGLCHDVTAQENEAVIFTNAQMGFTLQGADSILAIHDTTFKRGWNWVEMDSLSSVALGVNLWHLGDPWTWQHDTSAGTLATTDSQFVAHHLPRQYLIPTIEGISTSKLDGGAFTSPVEAMAMEYQPWLELDGDTFALRTSDTTGGVFGFRERSSLGSSIQDGDGVWRYRLEIGSFTAPTVVLSDVEHDEAMYRNIIGGQAAQSAPYLTDVLWLAINLRRNDTSSDVGQEDDIVLRLRVPYWRRDPCTAKTFAMFLHVPSATGTATNDVSDIGRPIGRHWPTAEVPTPGPYPDEIVITRRMLPAINEDDPDITIYAGLVFDHLNTGAADNPWQNPALNHDQSQKEPHLIDRLGIEVTFEDELGVDIKWVRLETTHSRDLFWGRRDGIIRSRMEEFVRNLREFKRQRYAANNDQPRLWRIYGRDEIRLSHFKGFRYVNRMLQDLVTTEWEIDEIAKARHCLRLKEQWQGHGFRVHPKIYSPTFRKGWFSTYGLTEQEAADRLNLYLNLYRGRDDDGYSETRLRVYRDPVVCDTTVITPGINVTVTQLPIAPTNLDAYIGRYAEGVMPTMEDYLYHHVRPNVSMLFDPQVPWFANIWTYSSANVWPDPDPHVLFISNGRPKSAEEMRLQFWSSLVLGAKGLVQYSGKSTGWVRDQTNWQALDWNGPHTGQGTIPTVQARDIGLTWQGYPYRFREIALTGGDRIDGDAMGGDYVQANDLDSLSIFLANPLAETAFALNDSLANPPGIYIGRKAARQITHEVYRTLDPYWATLRSLQLVGWRAKGYAQWFSGDSAAYSQWLKADSASQLVRVLHEPTAGIPWLPRQENYDSTFFDVTVHTAADTALSEIAYIGVLNRRTDCLTKTEVNGQFRTFDEFRSYVNDPVFGAPDSLFTQTGARRIRLPFNHTYTGPQGMNLHVEELRLLDTSQINRRAPIDTIIGCKTGLDIDFLPGEGKFFRVSKVAASSVGPNDGFLAHNNQRKMVAYPKMASWEVVTDTVDYRTYMRQINGDTMWYHRVYHRRRHDNAPMAPNYLSVYYQRSIPYVTSDNPPTGTADIFRASTVQWEPEILVSDTVVNMLFNEEGDTLKLSCGYPAIVVRPDTLDEWRVKAYVVYACESPSSEQVPYVLICEAVLPAEASAAQQNTYLSANHPQVLATAAINTAFADTLYHWGTPMINASLAGNFYCWSDAQAGIGVGFKQPDRRRFTAGQRAFIRAHNGMYATHPSLNSYSRLHMGEDDAGLVWQEGQNPTDGTFILYTRLKHDQNMDIYSELYAANNCHVKGPPLISGVNPQIASLASHFTTLQTGTVPEQEIAYHSFPVLYRHLSDWGLQSTSPWVDLHLVNLKAERAYWQSVPLVNHDRSMIGRRAFDIAEWSIIGTSSVDTLWSQTENYIFAEELDLLGPDVAQGEQWGQPDGDPPNASSFHEDSCSVLEFWSQTTQGPGTIWTMTFGFEEFYGQDKDHRHSELVSQGLLRNIQEQGLYPHLAARYSMMAHPGWQRNRRIFNATNGIWPNYQDAPSMVTSSKWFFKRQAIDNGQGFVYAGVRGAQGDALIGPVYVESLQRWLPFSREATADDRAKAETVQFATDWVAFSSIDDLMVMTKSWSEDTVVAKAYVERRSDGQRLELQAMATNQDGKVYRDSYTLIVDPKEEYRFVLEASAGDLWPTHDVEITASTPDGLAKGTRHTLLDLRSMFQAPSTRNMEQGTWNQASVLAYPNPAEDHVRLVVSLESTKQGTRHSAPGTTLTVSTLDGSTVVSVPCRSLDVVTLDTSSWPAGTYTVTATTPLGHRASTLLMVHR
jgi:hypothetical protein